MIVYVIQTLETNYSWLLVTKGGTFVVDCGDCHPIINSLQQLNLKLDYILLTHEHADHTQGSALLKAYTGAKIIAPFELSEDSGVNIVDLKISSEDIFSICGLQCLPIAAGGHSEHHVCYLITECAAKLRACKDTVYSVNDSNNHLKHQINKIESASAHMPVEPTAVSGGLTGYKLSDDGCALFSGDILFTLGCGRAFIDRFKLYKSLRKLRKLPDETVVFSGHCYAKANYAFTEFIGWPTGKYPPQKEKIVEPSTIGFERKYNPFFAFDNLQYKRKLDLGHLNDFDFFCYLRQLKDVY